MNLFLTVENLSVLFRSKAGEVHAVKDVSFTVGEGMSFGLVGESGSGKSTVLKAIAGLTHVTAGRIHIQGEPSGAPDRLSKARTLQMVFQDPYGSLHPRQTIEGQLNLVLKIHSLGERPRRIVEALSMVGLGTEFLYRYPHQLSGGQRQRVAIARALLLNPRLLLLDEPTSALDVSVQAEVLNLLMRLRREHGLTYVLVSHDLSVIGTMCDAVAVMKDGRVVEAMSVAQLRNRDTREEYTARLLLASEGRLNDLSEKTVTKVS